MAIARSSVDRKPVAITAPATPARLVSQSGFRLLVSTDDRGLRDAFVESWLENHAGDTPVVYMHHGNAVLSAYFRQIMPDCLQIGCTHRAEYDPMRNIPLPQFFSHVIARDAANHGKISIPYLKGIAALLLLERYEPTLYRLNAYAGRNLGNVIRRHEEDLDEDTYAMLHRFMNHSEAIVENTLDYLDMMCDACGGELNLGRMDSGKSIFSALQAGAGVSIDISKLVSNPIAANLVFAQLDYARAQGIRCPMILDLEYMPEVISNFILTTGTSNVALALTTNVWAMANTEFVQNLLSNRDGSVFVPNGNMTACRDISNHLDTYWRAQRTTTAGNSKGRNRRAFAILPTLANGRTSAISVTEVRDAVLSANDIRQLPRGMAIALFAGVPEIALCPLACS